MIAAMSLLTAEGSTVLARLEEFTVAFCSQSRLGYAIRMVRERLWDEVFAWAVVKGTWSDSDLQTIDDYLLGGTLFAYPSIFGTSFSTLSFLEAVSAATQDAPFPLRIHLGKYTRTKYPQLERSRRRVASLQHPPDADDRVKLRLANDNPALLLALGQRIPLDHAAPLDVDHIYPSALARRMHGSNPRAHHPDRWRVNSLGNKWYLDASANRSLQAMAPHPKFERLLKLALRRRVRSAGVAARQVGDRERRDRDVRARGQSAQRRHRRRDGRVLQAHVRPHREACLTSTMQEFPSARHFARDVTTIEPSAPAEPTTELLQGAR